MIVAAHVNGDALCFERTQHALIPVKWWCDAPTAPELNIDFWHEFDLWMNARLEKYDDPEQVA